MKSPPRNIPTLSFPLPTLPPIALLMALLTAVSGALGQDRPMPVAVLNFANQAQGPAAKEWQWLEKGLADQIINDLATQDGLVLVDRHHMQQTLEAKGLAVGPKPDTRRLGKAFARRFKVRRLVFGSFRVTEGKAMLNAMIADAKSGQLVDRLSVTGEADNVLRLEDQLAGEVAAALLDADDAEKRTADLPVWTDSVPASRLLYQAVDLFNQGRFEQAWLKVRRAREQDADYPDPRYWIGRLHCYMLQYDHARPYLAKFVKQHPDHSRVGDAAIEYLDTYVRGEDDPRKKAREAARLREAVPDDATIFFYRWQGYWGSALYNWNLRFYLAVREAQYWNAATEYARATRVLAPFFRKIKPWETNDGWGADFFGIVRQRTGTILGQPTNLNQFVGREPLTSENRGRQRWYQTYRSIRIRPGQDCTALLDENTNPTRATVVTQDWLIVPPNFSLKEVVLRAEARGPRDLPEAPVFFSLGLSHVRGHQYEDEQYGPPPHHLTSQFSQVRASMEVPPIRKLHKIGTSVLSTSNRPLVKWDPRDSCDIRSMAIKASLAKPEAHTHILLGVGHDLRTEPSPQLTPQPVHRVTWEDHLTFTPVTFARQAATQNRPLARLANTRKTAQPNQTTIALGRRSPRHLQGHKAVPEFRVAVRYAHELPEMNRAPQVVEGQEGQWIACWMVSGDLWVSVSRDEGEHWYAPWKLPVPVNTAHREGAPYLTTLSGGRYGLAFRSTRSIPRKPKWYYAISSDLRKWTQPRQVPIGTVRYVGTTSAGRLLCAGFDLEDQWPRRVQATMVDGAVDPTKWVIAHLNDQKSSVTTHFDAMDFTPYMIHLMAATYDSGQYRCWVRVHTGEQEALLEYTGGRASRIEARYAAIPRDEAQDPRVVIGKASWKPHTPYALVADDRLIFTALLADKSGQDGAWIFDGSSLADEFTRYRLPRGEFLIQDIRLTELTDENILIGGQRRLMQADRVIGESVTLSRCPKIEAKLDLVDLQNKRVGQVLERE